MRRKRASFLGRLAEGGLPDLTGPVEKHSGAQGAAGGPDAPHRGGQREALSVSDLIIAATAERHGAVVLHYDGDYDMIASVTGQATAWVTPAGTAD
ncbi:hypothetical protein [Streptomyces griseorubiginosus]|uniref:hypothetical protein n=1 Tax=Streptomyces griseorubiginosus TaxID=67304 RepID=UPI003F532623